MDRKKEVLKGDLIDVKYTNDGKFRPKYNGLYKSPEVTLNEDYTWEAEYRGEKVKGVLSKEVLENLSELGVILREGDENFRDSVIVYLKKAVVEWVSVGYGSGKKFMDDDDEV